MTVTLNHSPQDEVRLVEQARATGLSLDAYLESVIARSASSADAGEELPDLAREREDADRFVDEVLDAVEVPPGVGLGVMHRDDWYR